MNICRETRINKTSETFTFADTVKNISLQAKHSAYLGFGGDGQGVPNAA